MCLWVHARTDTCRFTHARTSNRIMLDTAAGTGVYLRVPRWPVPVRGTGGCGADPCSRDRPDSDAIAPASCPCRAVSPHILLWIAPGQHSRILDNAYLTVTPDISEALSTLAWE